MIAIAQCALVRGSLLSDTGGADRRTRERTACRCRRCRRRDRRSAERLARVVWVGRREPIPVCRPTQAWVSRPDAVHQWPACGVARTSRDLFTAMCHVACVRTPRRVLVCGWMFVCVCVCETCAMIASRRCYLCSSVARPVKQNEKQVLWYFFCFIQFKYIYMNILLL